MTALSKRVAVRIGGVFAGAGVLFVGGVLIASAPAFADNGPHVTNIGTTAIGSGPAGCAGCHRLHSSQQGQFLLTQSTEETLCLSCHEGGLGATTDVEAGVQYTASDGTKVKTANPALRGGGFGTAYIDAGNVSRTYTGSSINKINNTIPAAAASEAVNSSHALGLASATMWGNGAISGTASFGTAVDASVAGTTLECASCHDPHGNGNYRILRPTPSLGTAWSIGSAVHVTSVVASDDTVNTTNTVASPCVANVGKGCKSVYTFTLDTAVTVKPGEWMGFTGLTDLFAANNPKPYNATYSGLNGAIGPANVSSVSADGLTVTIPNQQNCTGAGANDCVRPAAGTFTPTAANTNVMLGFPSSIMYATNGGAGTTVTYVTWQNHGLAVGQKVTIAGSSVTGYNVTNGTIASVGNYNWGTSTLTACTAASATSNQTCNGFTIVLGAAPASAYKAAAAITGIPDTTNAKAYTTTNYWRADDHTYPGQVVDATTTAGATGTSAFIANTAQWCTTCHTRYLAANSTSRKYSSGDALFTYRHTSGAIKEDSPTCLQCHVAHGSNAAMGTVNGYSAQVNTPNNRAYDPATATWSGSEPVGGTTVPASTLTSSKLLRADNRAVCLLCHNY